MRVIVTTGDDVPGRPVVDILGIVRGIALRRPLSPDQPPLEPSLAARQVAELRLIDDAVALGAHAIIAMRYDSNDAEVVAYGTAVRLQPA